MGSQDSVQLPEYSTVTLDCLPFAMNASGMQANLYTIRWFQIATQSPETLHNETEIVNDMTMASISFPLSNKGILLIENLSIAIDAQPGTEAAYRCEVCRNVPADPLSCAATTTIVKAHSELATLSMHQ